MRGNRRTPVESEQKAGLTESGVGWFENSFGRDFVSPPLVSVIVTCFNYERYISDCLRSIVQQTYERIECIVVDDCSTDNSAQVIQDFIAGTDGAADFRLVANDVNGGQMQSFLTGFRNSSGAFVVFVDADDMLFPDFVETHVKAHLNGSYIAGISCSDEIIIDASNAILGGSIENAVKDRGGSLSVGHQVQVRASQAPGWHDTWRFGDTVKLSQREEPVLYVAPSGNVLHDWLWTTTSAVMFRRGVLELALTETVVDIRICADFFLLHFCHLVGGSLLIHSAHGCYRRHGSNHFASNTLIATGLSLGGGNGAMSNAQMWDRIRAELVRRFSGLCAVTGVPRALWIMAKAGRLRDCQAVSPFAAEHLRFGRLKFLALILFSRCRRYYHRIRRIFRLI